MGISKNAVTILFPLTIVAVLSIRDRTIAQTYQYFEITDSAVTEVWGIDGDNLVGWHQVIPGPGQPAQGFLYDGTTDTDINYPGAASTLPYDISGSNIVGAYRDASSVSHGFLYDGASYSPIDYPGSFQTLAYGVDGDNVVGYHLPGGGPGGGVHGFLYDGTNYSTIDYPGSQNSTRAYGISGSKILGEYIPGGVGLSHGFLYDGTNWTTLDYPGSFSTRAYGISGDSIVGVYTDIHATSHGFVYDGTDWYTVDYPFSTSSRALGIDGESIVGAYQSGSITQGFRSTKPVVPNEYIFRFTGEITSIDDEEGWFNGAFAVGQSVEGSYNVLDGRFSTGIHYADNGAGTSDVIDGTYYTYYLEANDEGLQPAPAHIQIEVGGQVYATGVSEFRRDLYLVRITDNADGSLGVAGDEFAVQSSAAFPDNFNNFLDSPQINIPPATLLLSLRDPGGTAISSFDLPITAPPLADFQAATGILDISDINGEILALMEFRIVSLIAVPEPATSVFLLSGVFGVITLGRHHRRSSSPPEVRRQ